MTESPKDLERGPIGLAAANCPEGELQGEEGAEEDPEVPGKLAALPVGQLVDHCAHREQEREQARRRGRERHRLRPRRHRGHQARRQVAPVLGGLGPGLLRGPLRQLPGGLGLRRAKDLDLGQLYPQALFDLALQRPHHQRGTHPDRRGRQHEPLELERDVGAPRDTGAVGRLAGPLARRLRHPPFLHELRVHQGGRPRAHGPAEVGADGDGAGGGGGGDGHALHDPGGEALEQVAHQLRVHRRHNRVDAPGGQGGRGHGLVEGGEAPLGVLGHLLGLVLQPEHRLQVPLQLHLAPRQARLQGPVYKPVIGCLGAAVSKRGASLRHLSGHSGELVHGGLRNGQSLGDLVLEPHHRVLGLDQLGRLLLGRRRRARVRGPELGERPSDDRHRAGPEGLDEEHRIGEVVPVPEQRETGHALDGAPRGLREVCDGGRHPLDAANNWVGMEVLRRGVALAVGSAEE
mmetsp:Transcript_62672/g.141566  ORF Transcript_62672/g.141566 Transcript_62672/m.141566 type:complete len:461 (+) Transcript_62672:60-1442(+)